ncbi:uncharacterized protein LOC144548795 [Carex rostrata]
MADSFLSSNFDLIFMILSLLPTETLLWVQTVCRTWARVISDPGFVRAHSSRPAPITAFFTPKDRVSRSDQWFKPIQDGGKFPTSISGFLSNGFKVASCNHGILCFRRDMVFVVGNPVNSSWSVVSYAPEFSSYRSYRYHGVALIYDPAISLNFKLALAFIKFDRSEEGKYWIRFHIYSSETGSWSISSEFIQWWFNMVGPMYVGIWESAQYEPCNIGGGSICWIESFGFLMGYDISTDTYWETQPPLPIKDARKSGDFPRGSGDMSGYDGIIYFTRMDYDVVKVWRLEGKNSWVVEDDSSEKLPQFFSHSFAYDRARRVLFIGDRTKRELFALHLSSSRLEILSQGDEFPKELFDSPQVAHGNTLAPLRGADTGMDGLTKEFCALGLSPLDL